MSDAFAGKYIGLPVVTGAYSGIQAMCTGADRGSQDVQGMRTGAISG